ncbi:MAG: family 1 glycosylhydrolase [Candidatus Methylomirabilis sp.]|nr:family 1 glycosylhydrolase [Deltaproteobacteria bacterium]
MLRRLATIGLFALAAACNNGSGGGAPAPDDPFTVTFPAGFLWGTGNAAYQSEGNYKPGGGRVLSNWSRWEEMGKIHSGDDNDRGVRFYEKAYYEADFDRAAADGHNVFRMGVEWARVEPERGVFDDAEMQHYVDLFQAAKDRGLTTMVTLYHWVTPRWAADPLPSVNRDLFATFPNEPLWDDFEAFTRYVVPRLEGLVDYWVTFNEPFTVVALGYLLGEHPPGKLLDLTGAINFVLNVAFMHGRAYDAIHELDDADADGDGEPALVSMAHHGNRVLPVDPSNADDQRGARHLEYLLNLLLIDAVTTGNVDADLDGVFNPDSANPYEDHYPELVGTMDYMGLNYYGPMRALGHLGPFPIGAPLYGLPLLMVDQYDPDLPHNVLNREISAQGFRDTLDLYWDRYRLPFFITENGTDRGVYQPGNREQATMYHMEHIYVLGRAIEDGIPVIGYLKWSLTDNFEWVEGFGPTFGLYGIDYGDPALPRIRTGNADVLADVIAAGGIDRALYDRYVLEKYPSDARE